LVFSSFSFLKIHLIFLPFSDGKLKINNFGGDDFIFCPFLCLVLKKFKIAER